MVDDAGELRCFDWSGKSPKGVGYDLDGKSWSLGANDQRKVATGTATLVVCGQFVT